VEAEVHPPLADEATSAAPNKQEVIYRRFNQIESVYPFRKNPRDLLPNVMIYLTPKRATRSTQDVRHDDPADTFFIGNRSH
jgi:hypothetical protein